MVFGGDFINKDSGKVINCSNNCNKIFGEVTQMSQNQGCVYLTRWCLDLSVKFPQQRGAEVILIS